MVGPVQAEASTWTVDGGNDCIVLPGAIGAVTSVVVDGTGLVEGTDYVVNKPAGLITAKLGGVFGVGQRNVVVSYTAPNSVTSSVKLAAMEIIRQLWQA